MQNNLRAAIAFLMLKLNEPSAPDTLYDALSYRHFHFIAEVTPHSIRILSHEAHVEISGYSHNGSLTLVDRHTRKQIAVNMAHGSFSGFDYASRSHFQGSVSNGAVHLFDQVTQQHCKYSA